jgi:ABC-type glycerol-3-phosphate transport system substrate-binding protein
VGKFLRFMATDEAQRALTFMGSLPASRSQYERVRDDDDVGPFVAGLDRARGVPLAESEAAQRIVDRALWLCLSGRATPAEALKAASTEEADRIL